MSSLRDPKKGCPWDLDQTFQSIAPHTIEEAYEVVDAIDSSDMGALKDELGDLLFQVVFLSQIAHEKKLFSFYDVVEEVTKKMVRRHPHVFGSDLTRDKDQQSLAWEKIKAAERQTKALYSGQNTDKSVLAGVVKSLPANSRAQKLQKRAASVGFDWPKTETILEKLFEEIEEVRAEIKINPCLDRVEDEIGDLFFTCANLARNLGIDAESSLRRANKKFEKRFRSMEHQADKKGIRLKNLDLDHLEVLWEEAKENT